MSTGPLATATRTLAAKADTITVNGGSHGDGGGGGGALHDVCLELQDKVDAFLAEDVPSKLLRDVQVQVREATAIINEALQRYSFDRLSLSYNGGKDCLVLLVLILACLPRHFASLSSSSSSPTTPNHAGADGHVDDGHAEAPPPPTANSHSNNDTTNTTATSNHGSSAPPSKPTRPHHHPHAPPPPPPRPFPESLQSVYIVSPHPFAEVDAFVAESVARYHLDLRRYGLPMRAALDAYLRERPAVRAVFVGTRRTDPHGARLGHFDPTDKGWPRFVRVHPVIDWHYAEIWAFIRHLDIPYLSLYDQGYTSLGGTQDTHPNPLLKKPQEEGKPGFRPAYELSEDNEERLGRDR